MTERAIKHHFFPELGLYLREAVIPKGHTILKHSHKTAHVSILKEGVVQMEYGSHIEIREAPSFIVVEAGMDHTIKALTDVRWYCEHITDENDVDKIDAVLVQEKHHAV